MLTTTTHYALALYENRAADLRAAAERERLADTARRYARATRPDVRRDRDLAGAAADDRRGAPARWLTWSPRLAWSRLAGRRGAAA